MLSLKKVFPRLGFCAALILSGGSSLSVFAALVPLQTATATFAQSGLTASNTIDGQLTTQSWAISGGQGSNQTIVWEAQNDVVGANGSNLTFTLIQNHTGAPNHTIEHFRLSVTGSNRSTFADGVQPSSSFVDGTATWVQLTSITRTDTGGATFTGNGDNTIKVSDANPDFDTYTITATSSLTAITGFRLEVFADGGVNDNVVGRSANGNIALSEFIVNAEAIAVPEPASISIFIAGIATLLVRRRRRRRQ
jgi:hypothetical protein